MKQILITGANKGIGLATARAILAQEADARVLFGSRDIERGQVAVDTLYRHNLEWRERVTLVPIDVTDAASVLRARESFDKSADTSLYGIVNNAGVGLGSTDVRTVVDVNVLGVKRVCDAFLPLPGDGGRIVNVSSASGPNFVSACSASRQAFFRDSTVEWPAIEALIDKVVSVSEGGADDGSLGLDVGNAYGFSKACVTLYTMLLARENPHLLINACTPGYIETDLTRPSAERQGVAPADMGMKSPEHGTVSILHLLFGQPHGSGHYYGSDAKRSPLDHYRAPGSPEYQG